MQATVHRWSAQDGGSVLLDDGTELPFDAAAFAASGLRLLRFGQRVRVTVHGQGTERRVVALTIATLPQAPAATAPGSSAGSSAGSSPATSPG